MSIQSEIANMHALMLRKGASQETAHTVALALYHELVPGCDFCAAREAVARALTTAKAGRPAFGQALPRHTTSPAPTDPPEADADRALGEVAR